MRKSRKGIVMRANSVPFSVYGIPALGLVGLLICLWHPQVKLPTEMTSSSMMCLADPNPQLDKIRTVFLLQEAKDVAYSRKHDLPATQAKIIADYNLIAQECTPAVFQTTHLPASL